MKNVLLLGDFHCGHVVGLTPPEWIGNNATNTVSKRNKWVNIRNELWFEFTEILDQLPKIDVMVANGDLIEGKGERSGGTELMTADMQEQCDMAVTIFEKIREHCHKNVKIISTFGTPYHTSTNGDEWENVIATRAGFDKIGAHEWIDVNGYIFDVKHHIGSSSVPHSRHTASARDGVWNDLWSIRDMQPRADAIIRSHVHYFTFGGTSNKLYMTLPALQAMGSKYGAKRCSGTVDWGMILFQVKDKDNYDWHPFIRQIKTQKPKVVKV